MTHSKIARIAKAAGKLAAVLVEAECQSPLDSLMVFRQLADLNQRANALALQFPRSLRRIATATRELRTEIARGR